MRRCCSPEKQSEQLKSSRRKTRVPVVDCRVFASQRQHRVGVVVASSAASESRRLSAAPVDGPAPKAVIAPSDKSRAAVRSRFAEGVLRSNWNPCSVASVWCACSLWCPGAKGRRIGRGGAAPLDQRRTLGRRPSAAGLGRRPPVGRSASFGGLCGFNNRAPNTSFQRTSGLACGQPCRR